MNEQEMEYRVSQLEQHFAKANGAMLEGLSKIIGVLQAMRKSDCDLPPYCLDSPAPEQVSGGSEYKKPYDS